MAREVFQLINFFLRLFFNYPSIINQTVNFNVMDEEILKVWSEMSERLFNFVNQKVNDRELSKDIVQDVFVKIFFE